MAHTREGDSFRQSNFVALEEPGTCSQANEKTSGHGPNLVDWDGPENLQSPYNWPRWKHHAHIVIAGTSAFLVFVLVIIASLICGEYKGANHKAQQRCTVAHQRICSLKHHRGNPHRLDLPPRLCIRAACSRAPIRTLRASPRLPDQPDVDHRLSHRMLASDGNCYVPRIPRIDRHCRVRAGHYMRRDDCGYGTKRAEG